MWVKNSHHHHYFCVFPEKMCCFWRSRWEERGEREGRGREEEGGGEGGSRVLDISDGQRASIRRTGSEVSLDSHFCSSWSNFVHDVASKMYVFQLKDNIFHQIGPSCWQGPKM